MKASADSANCGSSSGGSSSSSNSGSSGCRLRRRQSNSGHRHTVSGGICRQRVIAHATPCAGGVTSGRVVPAARAEARWTVIKAPTLMVTLWTLGVLGSSWCAGPAHAHQYSLGACPPEVPFKANFDVDRFLGEWFVTQKSHSTVSCLKVNISRGPGEDLKITEYRRIGLLQKAFDHTLIDVGVLRIPDQTEAAKMTVKFSLSAWTEPFTVMDTDYDQYAATFSCVAAAGLGHRKNGMILSRRPFLDNAIADKLRKSFDYFGVGASSLSFIDQRPCSGLLKSKSDHDRVISIGPLNINRKADP